MQGQVDNLAGGMEKLHSLTEAQFEALRLKVGHGDALPDDDVAMTADKKRMVSEAVSAWPRSVGEGSFVRACALASSGAGAPSSAGAARSTSSTFGGARRGAGHSRNPRCLFVVKLR